jgi:hypothetical protein
MWMQRKLLAIYLNDHLAGATVGVSLAARSAASNQDDETFGAPLRELASEIQEDRESLLGIMRELEIATDPVKRVLAWGAEKAGRLKLNGRLLSYSPLSRLDELEFLALGVTGKRALWRSLELLSPAELKLHEEQLGRLIARAERQLERIETYRRLAVVAAFTP